MNIITFSADALQRHQMWYALIEQYGDELDICIPTGSGLQPYNGATAYKMFNGRVIIGFDSAIQAQSQNGIVVVSGETAEYATTQPFERIKQICEIAPPNDNLGTFAFTDSKIISSSLDWRCDNSRYGPAPYSDINGEEHRPITDQSVLVQYEPILSVSGIAHLAYIRRTNYEVQRNEYLNNSLTQTVTATLPEMLVLLNEWAIVSEAPFNNDEEIAKDAKKFLEAIHFTTGIIDGYSPMQLSRFLSGDINARQRPDNPLPPSEYMLSFIRAKTSHLSLAGLLSTDRGLWDVEDIAQLEEETLLNNMLSLHKQFYTSDAPEDMDYVKFTELVERTMPLERQPYVKSWINAYKTAEEIRHSLSNN